MTVREGEGGLARGLGLLLLLGGLGLEGWLLAAGAWPSLFPLLLAALGIPPLLLGIRARRAAEAGTPAGPLLRHADAAGGACVAGALLLLFLSVGRVREEEHAMVWSFERDEAGVEDRGHVLLEFADHPGWISRIRSRELGAYLEGLGTDRVTAVFRVTRDFGSVRSIEEIRVGERTSWREERLGGMSRRRTSRVRGEIGPSPFE